MAAEALIIAEAEELREKFEAAFWCDDLGLYAIALDGNKERCDVMSLSVGEREAGDDAATAYSFAAPQIHGLFPQAELFMSMVQRGYPPVYRHKSFEFGESRSEGGWIAQRVHIVDANGEPWEALYTLEQQPDGSLKITGCTLLKAGQDVWIALDVASSELWAGPNEKRT